MEHLTVELVHQFLSGQMHSADECRWRAHLDECARCRELVENERTWNSMLNLGEADDPAKPTAMERVLDRVEHVVPQRRTRRRRRLVALLGGWTLAALLTALLVWQVSYPPGTTDPDAATSVAHELRTETVAHLDELRALERDPWLLDDYETVKTLDDLIREYRP